MMLWYEKYRPRSLDDYAWPSEKTKNNLVKWSDDPLGHPSLLLSGPTGTGKTTLAKILMSMLDDSADIKFIPASLRSGVDTIRDEIVGFCEAGGFLGLKIIVLDEADRLSQDAQQMMRNVMDRYIEDVRFIFTCNYPDKIIDAIHGRCWDIKIDQLDFDMYIDRLAEILSHENIDLDNDQFLEQFEDIANQTYPNMRKAISQLQMGITGYEDTETTLEDDLISLLTDFTVMKARQFVSGIRPNQYSDVYKYLYENSEMFDEAEGEAVLIIADHMYKGSIATMPDMTLCSCLVRLDKVVA